MVENSQQREISQLRLRGLKKLRLLKPHLKRKERVKAKILRRRRTQMTEMESSSIYSLTKMRSSRRLAISNLMPSRS